MHQVIRLRGQAAGAVRDRAYAQQQGGRGFGVEVERLPSKHLLEGRESKDTRDKDRCFFIPLMTSTLLLDTPVRLDILT